MVKITVHCPNCGSQVSGNFCNNCGFRIIENTLPQQLPPRYKHPSGATHGHREPPIRVAIGKSPIAKDGLILLMISILGLIIFTGVPWIVVEREIDDGVTGTFAFNYDLKLVWGDEEEWGSDEFSPFYDDIYKDSIGLAFIGLIFSVVLTISMLITGINSVSGGFKKEFIHGINAIIGVILLIPGTIITVSGMDFIGLK
jgi:hypothetical protein